MAACDPWTEQEMILLLECNAMGAGDRVRNQCLFAMQCCTGGRISELLGLTRKDVIDDIGRPYQRISFTNTKNGETRTVDMINPFALPFIRSWLLRLEEWGFAHGRNHLFVNTVGEPLTRHRWWTIIKAASKECSLRGHYGTHSARKTWARDTYKHYHARAMTGELVDPLIKLQEAGGWKTIDSARRYIAFMLGDTAQAMVALYPELQKKYGRPQDLTGN